MNHIEREFKWHVSCPKDFENFTHIIKQLASCVLAKQDLTIIDCYLDNAKHDFSKQKMALRLRCINGQFEATLKTRTEIKNGLACRRELTLALPHQATRKQALYALQRYEKWEGISLKKLQLSFVIKNNRTVYMIQYKNCFCEVALDNYLTLAQGHQMRRREIELEFKRGRMADFEKLIQQITVKSNLLIAKISKVAGAEKWIKQKFRLN